MAGTFSAARGVERLSLVKERGKVRIESQIANCSDPSRSSSPFILRGEARKHVGLHLRRALRAPIAGPTRPNILWSDLIKNPPNCVFFACNHSAPAVLTSLGPRFGLPCIY